MKKSIIIFNIIFLTFGNVLLSGIHNHIHHHDGHYHTEYENEKDECFECINIDNNNYVLDSDRINFSINDFDLFFTYNLKVCDFKIIEKYLSRAPPLSPNI